MLACQFVLFGNLTAEGAKHFFSHSEAGWERQEASPVIEREFARSAVRFAERPQPAAGRARSGEGQGSGRANAGGRVSPVGDDRDHGFASVGSGQPHGADRPGRGHGGGSRGEPLCGPLAAAGTVAAALFGMMLLGKLRMLVFVYFGWATIMSIPVGFFQYTDEILVVLLYAFLVMETITGKLGRSADTRGFRRVWCSASRGWLSSPPW